ncbi:glycosyltransferase family 2 protein [Roseovarius dicentrarchi]|uniref:glycosyltransferase family 2 protein n=1 Tax=Roseovarius dicentrarchi TaxID=2250573 RepID=UPI000DEAFDE6|nr:glycosyltransferase family 2 protein [Roseovarius dicentrarchi]
MHYTSVHDLCARGARHLAKGPVALIFAEDDAELETTLRHHVSLGFVSVIMFLPAAFSLQSDPGGTIVRVDHDVAAVGHLDAMNRLIGAAAPGTWLYYCFNAEYLFYPFCESRSVGELLAFHTEERRDAMLAYVVDIYAGDLTRHPGAVSLKDTWLDKSGYYALARPDPDNNGYPKERQLDFFGGLRWRYEEHIPARRRNIDRIAVFRAKPGLKLRPEHVFTDEEYNTYACPWHNNLTAAIVSFRTAKALKRNPGSTFDIHTFKWHNSVPFEWHSRQLLDLGLMEPGQWF